jgi:hypothetical protein
MLDKIAKLIDVKTLVTFTVIAVFATLALTGKIDVKDVMQVVLIIITFFFAKRDDTSTTLPR